MFVNVFSNSPISFGESLIKRFRIEGVSGEVGVARTCCTFLAPASWVRIVGHLMAFDRSIWRRAFHAASSG